MLSEAAKLAQLAKRALTLQETRDHNVPTRQRRSSHADTKHDTTARQDSLVMRPSQAEWVVHAANFLSKCESGAKAAKTAVK